MKYFYNLLVLKFDSMTPIKQIVLLLVLGSIVANILAVLFFHLGGYDRADKTIYLTTLIVLVVGGPLGAFLIGQNYKLKVMAEELETAFRKDGMTGLTTRHEFHLRAERLIRKCNPALSAGAVLYIDADRFKTINDRFGHMIGDGVLLELGTMIRETLGRRDVGARFGGKEFAIFLTDADFGQAAWMAEKILLGARGISRNIHDQELSMTVSIGVSFHEPGQTLEHLLGTAEDRLLRAKELGRNRVVFAEIKSHA
jgi:diguanylate cyclase (GGDEF)-like protein